MIATTTELTRFPSHITNTDTGIPLVKTSESNYTHVSISIPAHDTRSLDTNTARKNYKIIPSEFEHWIQSNGGEKDFSLLINTKVTRRKRRSLLSNVSYASFSDDSISSSSSSEEENEADYIPLTKEHNNELQQKNKIPQPLLSPPASSKSSPVKKSSSWLSGLFQKQSKPISNNKKSKSGTLFNFFSSSKTSKQQQLSPKSSSSPAPQPKSLPKRYPMPIERVIYQIAFIKLRNPKRPLQHQVVVCNMIQWYTSIITKEATACKRHQLYLQKSLSM